MDTFISLGLLANRASTVLSQAMNMALANAGIDLPHSQFIVLRCLYFNDGVSQLKIAHLLSKDAAAIKRTIDNLKRKGLVVRENVSTLKNSIHITDKGKRMMPEILNIAEQTTEKALAGMDEHCRKALYEALEKICNNLK